MNGCFFFLSFCICVCVCVCLGFVVITSLMAMLVDVITFDADFLLLWKKLLDILQFVLENCVGACLTVLRNFLLQCESC